MSVKRILIAGILVVISMIILVACGPQPDATLQISTATTGTQPEAGGENPSLVIPFQAEWAASGHADINAPAFNHWNEADPLVITAACVKCHSSNGLEEFIRTGANQDAQVPGGVINCTTCHNESVSSLIEVTFPSGKVVGNLGAEARCLSCHQGRESKTSLDAYIEMNAGAEAAPDVVVPGLSFRSVHYFTAGATMYASMVSGGYEYEDQVYDGKYTHIENMDTCLDCHDNHSLEIKVFKCAECHEFSSSTEDLKGTRMLGSLMDYDGDGDRAEGIYFEIEGLQQKLLDAMQAYGTSINSDAIVYSPDTYPYFFSDGDQDGTLSKTEEKAENAYISWTPRLLKAAYNYQFTVKDPGAYAHNAKYAIELLYDSINDLNRVLPVPEDLDSAERIDFRHFAGSAQAFRHWDKAGEVEAECAKCHTAYGLPQFLKNGANIAVTISDGLMCSTCHIMEEIPTLRTVASVTFPGGKEVSFAGQDVDGNFMVDESNICLECHQGRESTASVNAMINGLDGNTVDPKLSFGNVHYYAAGASLFGNDAQVAYQYPGQEYVGRYSAHPIGKCAECHDTHSGLIKVDTCAACHPGNSTPATIRYGIDKTDWDRDGNNSEPIKEEISTLQGVLLNQILAYSNQVEAPIAYGPLYPYWVKDLNGNGLQDMDEGGPGNAYTSFTPNLLTAAYNYHFLVQEPGNYAHNPMYSIQLLQDSIAAVGGDVSGYFRP